jgi:hypothetical protein
MLRFIQDDRARRGPLVAAALLLFVAGTQFCLLGAFAPRSPLAARLGCAMLDPATALASTASHCGGAPATPAPASSCCGTQAPADDAPEEPAHGALPCCLAFAPVVDTAAPDLGAAAETTLLLVALPGGPAPERAAHAAFTVERDTGPPASHAPAPFGGRAPPIL